MTKPAPRRAADDDIGVVLMCEPAAYEWQAILLVSSLLSFAGPRTSIYAYCRRAIADQIHPRTREFFDRHGVGFEVIDPEFRVNYPQGNKLFACAMPRAEARTVFVDTDVMLMRPTALEEAFLRHCVCGRKTGAWMWGKTPEAWAPAYAAVGLPLPPRRMPQAYDGEVRHVPPSLNAGVVFYDDPRFSSAWLSVAKRIEADATVKEIFPTLDQIALPVAAASLDLDLRFLDPTWNAGPRQAE